MTPPTHALAPDRLCLVVDDLDQAAAHARSLGFTLTPEGEHMVGSRNRCVMLRGGQYLELLDPHATVPDPASQAYERRLRRFGEGLAVLSLRCEDLHALAETWRQAGFNPSPVRPYSRTIDLPTGRTEARFELIQLPHPPLPGVPSLAICACRQLTPDVVWRPDCLDHPNGAAALTGLELYSDAPHKDASVLSHLTQIPWHPTPTGPDLTLGTVRIHLRHTTRRRPIVQPAVLTLESPCPISRAALCGTELLASEGDERPK
ncbi:VOC family protein [Streptomyces sp. NPDC050658]|uniref:VOC family protein n=1 Tax=unclassified Streptomyces TaxID=2593676 RepID=UPI003413EEBF